MCLEKARLFDNSTKAKKHAIFLCSNFGLKYLPKLGGHETWKTKKETLDCGEKSN